MARIDLDLAHAYRPHPTQESDYALLPLKMSFRDGGAYALLGPSGCGKTTMLNIISGLLVPSQGTVSFDGRDVTHATPQERNIAQVFQFPVIYDTMTVAENLAFPLRNRKMPADADQEARGRDRRDARHERPAQPARRRAWRPMPSRRSRWAAGWCATTSRPCSSTSR